jgi:predicted dehydrogenase
MKKSTVAIVGCGWIGLGAQLDELRIKPASHAEAVWMNPRTELKALVDDNAEAIAQAAKLYPSVPRFSNLKEMFAQLTPDIVVIATTPDSHCQLVKEAAMHPVKAILCEKPISHEIDEARKVVDFCKQKQIPLFVNHMRRFDPLIRRYRDYISGGYLRDTFLGPIKTVTAYYDKGLFHCGTHIVDLLRFYLGEVQWVSATENSFFSTCSDDFSVDGIIGFKTTQAVLQVFNSPEYAVPEVCFFGERGRLNLRHMWGLEMEIIGTRTCDDVSAYRELDTDHKRVVGDKRSFFAPILDHILNCLEGSETPLSTGEDALKTLEVLIAMRESAHRNGAQVRLS